MLMSMGHGPASLVAGWSLEAGYQHARVPGRQQQQAAAAGTSTSAGAQSKPNY